jgi:hypothetical protein
MGTGVFDYICDGESEDGQSYDRLISGFNRDGIIRQINRWFMQVNERKMQVGV